MDAKPRNVHGAWHGYCAVVDQAQDDVDRIVAAWRRERPDLDVGPLAIMSRLSRLSRRLDGARRQAFADSDLEPWEFDVLAALRRAGDPYRLTPGELLKETLVTSGTMTNRVDRLVARGLVLRTASAGDRRAVLVSLTPEGQRCVDDALTRLVGLEREFLQPLDDEARERLVVSLRSLLGPLEHYRP
ncbi:MAG: MarR family transcriptional regulator [Actinobacteria bacterium]|nr:MarR family transcriptional regulator [Actinomycetota bacterium]